MRAELLSVHVQLLHAGTLAEQLGEQKDSVVALKITGPINGTDVLVLREMLGMDFEGHLIDCNLRILDLEDARIVEGGDVYFYPYTKTEKDVVSANMFYWCYGLVYIALPSNVVKIDDFAFNACMNLRYVKFPETLQSIGMSAFHSCTSLQELELPQSMRSIGFRAFNHCNSLKHVNLPDGITEMDIAFMLCDSLQTIHLPASLKEVSPGLLNSCPELRFRANALQLTN